MANDVGLLDGLVVALSAVEILPHLGYTRKHCRVPIPLKDRVNDKQATAGHFASSLSFSV